MELVQPSEYRCGCGNGESGMVDEDRRQGCVEAREGLVGIGLGEGDRGDAGVEVDVPGPVQLGQGFIREPLGITRGGAITATIDRLTGPIRTPVAHCYSPGPVRSSVK